MPTYQYPGLGLPVRYAGGRGVEHYPITSARDKPGCNVELLSVREVAMMIVMDRLMDKPEWHKKVFDETVVAHWRADVLAISDESLWTQATGKELREGETMATHPDYRIVDIIDGPTFDCCIQELRNKAAHYEKTGISVTLDVLACVAKSDTLVPDELASELRQSVATLLKDQGDKPDWHPNSNDMVMDLVHPSMYPLVYGKTNVLEDEVVGIEDAITKWAGAGTTVEKFVIAEEDKYAVEEDILADLEYQVYGRNEALYWSFDYQWLPANMAFQPDGSLRFTSYINNLHPDKYPQIYKAIERFAGTVAVPLWEQCLASYTGDDINGAEGEKCVRLGAGREKLRIPLPDDPNDSHPDRWIPMNENELKRQTKLKRKFQDGSANGNADLGGPGQEPLGYTRKDRDGEGDGGGDGEDEDDNEGEVDLEEDEFWEEEWRACRRPVLLHPQFSPVDYQPPIRLADKFGKKGLQVIVKMVSIELTPEKPEFPAGGWHIEGMLNEKICGTVLYYLDSENITTDELAFRMIAPTERDSPPFYDVHQGEYNWLQSTLGRMMHGWYEGDYSLQRLGSVETRPGRVVAFPNTLQHAVSSFRLQDPSKPGHRRFLALWLVDPHTRIISTANVPPQQREWWIESVLGSTEEERAAKVWNMNPQLAQLLREQGLAFGTVRAENRGAHLPEEVMDKIRSDFDMGGLMTREEALEHRLRLMGERSLHKDENQKDWEQGGFDLCEH